MLLDYIGLLVCLSALLILKAVNMTDSLLFPTLTSENKFWTTVNKEIN